MIIVVGCSRGLGKAILVELSQHTKEFIVGIGRGPEALRVCQEEAARRGGGRLVCVQGDAGLADTWQRVRTVIGTAAVEDRRVRAMVVSAWGGDSAMLWDSQALHRTPLAQAAPALEAATASLRAHYMSARAFASLVHGDDDLWRSAAQGDRPTFVSLGDGDSFHYRGDLEYDLAKAGVARLPVVLSASPSFVGTAIGVTPGFLRSEATLATFGVTEETYKQAADPDFAAASETPTFLARLLVSLLTEDTAPMRSLRASLHGRLASTWSLSEHMPDVTDTDGTRPHWGRYFREKYGSFCTPTDEFFVDHLIRGPTAVVAEATATTTERSEETETDAEPSAKRQRQQGQH